MSMINCPECNKEISDQAKVCVGCGIRLSKFKSMEAKLTEKKNRTNLLSIAAIGISILALLMSLSTDISASESISLSFFTALPHLTLTFSAVSETIFEISADEQP